MASQCFCIIKRVRLEDYYFSLVPIEQYIEKTGKRLLIKIPETPLIKKSQLQASGLGEIDMLSFFSERIIFKSNLPRMFFETAGTMKVFTSRTALFFNSIR